MQRILKNISSGKKSPNPRSLTYQYTAGLRTSESRFAVTCSLICSDQHPCTNDWGIICMRNI